MSLPPREAWIEIFPGAVATAAPWSLPPREAWIEIRVNGNAVKDVHSRFPRGKRGLKWHQSLLFHAFTAVASPAGSVD